MSPPVSHATNAGKKNAEILHCNLSSATVITGKKRYELTNHLGNVLATISYVSPINNPIDYNNDNSTDYELPEIISVGDYYAFGMLMPGRIWTKFMIRNKN